MKLNDEKVFFGKWLRDPFRIGAVMPSGAALAKAVSKAAGQGKRGAVVELGGGTGAVTRALLETGIAPSDLIIVERDEGLYRILVQRFPGSLVIHGDATRLKDLVHAAGISSVKTVVSGLPLLTMPARIQKRLLHEAFALMDEDGLFIQFTYGLASPVPERRLARMGLKAQLAARVWRNVPPATVWRYTRIHKGAALGERKREGTAAVGAGA